MHPFYAPLCFHQPCNHKLFAWQSLSMKREWHVHFHAASHFMLHVASCKMPALFWWLHNNPLLMACCIPLHAASHAASHLLRPCNHTLFAWHSLLMGNECTLCMLHYTCTSYQMTSCVAAESHDCDWQSHAHMHQRSTAQSLKHSTAMCLSCHIAHVLCVLLVAVL